MQFLTDFSLYYKWLNNQIKHEHRNITCNLMDTNSNEFTSPTLLTYTNIYTHRVPKIQIMKVSLQNMPSPPPPKLCQHKKHTELSSPGYYELRPSIAYGSSRGWGGDTYVDPYNARFLESPRTDPPVSKRQIISPVYFATDPNRSTKMSQKKALS